MSDADRDKWNSRYREGAYRDRQYPSVLLEQQVPDILCHQRSASHSNTRPRALDLACGSGRNALYLARLGYQVDAVDISAEALSQARKSARGVPITWMERDLDEGLPGALRDYDLIVMIRYLDMLLVHTAAERLHPGGYLVCETHLQTTEAVAGPSTATFRSEPGALRQAAGDLDIVLYHEGITEDPDGRKVALAQLVATRT
jgi:SAM-dependent methyltransferase